MALTILSVAYPFAVMGPGSVGGAEQILTVLEAELVSQGFDSLVVAREGSVPAGRLLASPVPSGVITDEVRDEVTRAHQANIDRAFANHAIDLVHMHGIDFHRYRIPAGVAVLVTLHLPPSWYPVEIWRLPSNYQMQCVSETQRLACPEAIREHLPVIENGVALPPADKLPTRRNYAVMLARICPEKNLHEGMDAARLAGVPVLLAGEAFPYAEHLQYLHEQIEPRLGEGARLLGPVGGAEKTRLLARARCLLLPTTAPETSSLAAMEAFAVGTPVVAYRSGAIPEIVEDGRTGFLVDDVSGMAAAIERVGEIDPAECRRVVASRFPLSRMVQGYTELYGQMLGKTSRSSEHTSAELARNEESRTHPDASDGVAGARAANSTLTLAVLTKTCELEALVPEWTSLWQADRRATPFGSPEWLLPWWRHVGVGELFTVTIRGGGDDRLIGLLPMYVYTQPKDGERHLLLLGAGTSDYLDGLFASNAEAERIAEAALGELARHRDRWDRAFLHQLRENSPLLAWARRAGWKSFHSDPCSSVQVEGWARLPAKIRLNSGRYRRRAEARGRLSFTCAATADEAKGSLDDLIALHAKRWQDDGVLTSSAVQQHHRESVPRLREAKLLAMLSLKLDGRTVAVLYALLDPPLRAREGGERRMYSYLIGFDPEYGDLSPGTLLLSYAFDQCEAGGITRLDMLRGGEGYKHLWGAVLEPTFGFELPEPRS